MKLSSQSRGRQPLARCCPAIRPAPSGTAVWAPVLAWSLLHSLHFEGVELFDQLRLRHALAQIFHSLGMSGEDGWRAAARVRFLLHRQDPFSPNLSHREWQDGDVHWLTGTHESEGVRYFNKESHEELLWWLQMPALLAAPPRRQRDAAKESGDAVANAVAAAKSAGYKLDILLRAGSTGSPGSQVRSNVKQSNVKTSSARPGQAKSAAKKSAKRGAQESSSRKGTATATAKETSGSKNSGAAKAQKPQEQKGKSGAAKTNGTLTRSDARVETSNADKSKG